MTVDWLVLKVKRSGVTVPDLWQKVLAKSHGMDFTDNYSPVVNDVTLRVVVGRMLSENMKGK